MYCLFKMAPPQKCPSSAVCSDTCHGAALMSMSALPAMRSLAGSCLVAGSILFTFEKKNFNNKGVYDLDISDT